MKKTIGLLTFLGPLLTACEGEQSVFSSAGPYAQTIEWLSSLMFISAALITLFMVILTAIALFAPAAWRKNIAREQNVVLGGIIFPVVVLTALLVYGFTLLAKANQQLQSSDALNITVVGEQWWWRVIYELDSGRKFETANELRIPVNQPVRLSLATADVIHSFWIPAYGGKVDMIPGRINTMDIFIQTPGVYRGQCAEYCGGAHALMSLYSVAMLPQEFDRWFFAASQDANASANADGRERFIQNGCGSCHTVRGTSATGNIAPDLTHVGSRLTIGAGILRVSKSNLADWIEHHKRIKPDNLMPEFKHLTNEDVTSIAEFLHQLK